MTYAEKLKDPRWQKKRLEILDRDGWKCRECGSTDSELHVHHGFYIPKRDPWDYPDHVFRTLCKDCHKKRTEVNVQVSIMLSHVSTDILDAFMHAMETFHMSPPVSAEYSNVEFFIFGSYLPCIEKPGALCSMESLKSRTDGEVRRLDSML